MMNSWRSFVLAAAASVTIGVAGVSAQTVVVSKAPEGSTVELVLNGATIGSATVDSAGFATLQVNLATQLKKSETDVYIFVEQCANARKVIMAERGQQPPPPPSDCDRRDMGLFLLRRVSTVSVDVGGPNPTLLLVQGRYDPKNPRPIRPWNAAPTGFVLSAAGGLMRFSEIETISCGDVSDCSGGGFKSGYTLTATHWIKPFLAAEVSFLKPAEATAAGAGQGFRFTSSLDARALTVSGKAAVPAGPIRVYGKGGGTFQQATFETVQTHDATATAGSATQTYELKTEGWGWVVGGGIEVWLKRHFGAYVEFGLTKLKGTPIDESEGDLSERVMSVVIGAQVHIGR